MHIGYNYFIFWRAFLQGVPWLPMCPCVKDVFIVLLFYRSTMLRKDPDLAIFFNQDDTATLFIIKGFSIISSFAIPDRIDNSSISINQDIKLAPVYRI